MSKTIATVGMIALAAIVLSAAVALADDKEEKIPPDKLPAKILEAIKGRFPKAEITSAEKEKEDGKIVYDIELKSDGKKYEMDILEDGTIIEIEKEVAVNKLPDGAAKTIEEKYPKSKILEVMEVNKVEGKKETPQHYEVTIETADKKKKEVILALDGKSVKEEGREARERLFPLLARRRTRALHRPFFSVLPKQRHNTGRIFEPWSGPFEDEQQGPNQPQLRFCGFDPSPPVFYPLASLLALHGKGDFHVRTRNRNRFQASAFVCSGAAHVRARGHRFKRDLPRDRR